MEKEKGLCDDFILLFMYSLIGKLMIQTDLYVLSLFIVTQYASCLQRTCDLKVLPFRDYTWLNLNISTDEPLDFVGTKVLTLE